MAKIVAILLSAGESRRMGQLKALLPWQGVSLLAHQVSALKEAGVDHIIVVLGHRSHELQPMLEDQAGVTTVLNPDYLQGKTTSIKAGVGILSQDKIAALLILNVDQPRSAKTIHDLLESHRSGDALITVPTYRGKGGHPIVLSPSLIPELLSINEETQGMKAVVQRHRDQTQKVEMEGPEVLWDLNTPEQYQEAIRSLG
jgi:molybdenum cofactor cytidylyltransferase